MSKQTLFAISQDLDALDDLIYECDGNLDNPQVVEALKAFESEIITNMEQKVDNYAAFIKILVARAEARNDEAKRLAVRAKVDKENAKSLADRLKMVFEYHDIKKMETSRFRVGIVNNGGVLPLIIDCDASKLPAEYQVKETVITPNTDALRDALAAGESIDGVRLGERGQRLSIK